MIETTDDREAAAGEAAPGGAMPPPSPSSAPSPRPLRRSVTDRYGVGLAGGLGQYFGVDPVIFRVAFVVLSFFGGLGIFAYLAGYALVPEEGTTRTSGDRVAEWLRRKRISPALVVVGALVLVWAGLFSWWLPEPFLPTVAVVGLLVYLAMRRRPGPPPPPPPPSSSGAADWPPPEAAPAPDATTPPPPTARSRAVAQWRERRARRRPVVVVTMIALVVTWAAMALIDRATAVPLGVMVWTGLAVVAAGFLAGVLWRRVAWILLVPLAVLVALVAVFGGSSARLSDGTGDKVWTPTTVGEVQAEYALAFGRTTLDLTELPAAADVGSVRIVQGAGEVVVRLPETIDVDLHVEIQAGDLQAAGADRDGWGLTRDVHDQGPDGEGGGRVDLDIELAAGQVRLVRTDE